MTYEQRRRMIIIAIIAFFLFIIGFIILGLREDKEGARPEALSEPAAPSPAGEPSQPATEEELQAIVLPTPFSEARRVARTFVERYGSYSTQTNFQNLEDVMYLAADTLKISLQKTLEEKRKSAAAEFAYSGMTTQVLSDEIVSGGLGDEKVVVLLKTQRSSSNGSAANVKTVYQDAEVTLLKIEGEWKVESIAWK
ncbi:MAG: hypothetical protein HY602_00685 [Parcubacteria group bacterium]|nr:hypothetical protein [Parcubacteria group bacterium]